MPDKRPMDAREEAARAKAATLHADGMPFQMAMAVAFGRMDLSEALERMAWKQRAIRIEAEHGIPRALATQVAMGQVDLEVVLRRRRFAQHREQNRDRSFIEIGGVLDVRMHGGRSLTGTVTAITPYEVSFTTSSEEQLVHKLELAVVTRKSDWKKVKKGIRRDSSVAKQDLAPIAKPQDRYGCSDKRLFTYLDKQSDITVVLRSGDVVKGRVIWFSRFEFELESKGGLRVGVFRHALHDVRSNSTSR